MTTTYRAYCWGTRPTAVLGKHLFRQVSVGPEHTCGVTTDDQAFCWGSNVFGQLGTGTFDPQGTVAQQPVAVVGMLKFSTVSVGAYHTCGVTTDSRAYCWGGDRWGQLGDGVGSDTCEFSQPCLTRPRLVTGGHRFSQLEAGGGLGPGEDGVGGDDGGHTCAVTTDGQAYCWGVGAHGQNGDGTLSTRTAPRLVAGGLLFRSVSLGVYHVCGVTTADRAYCWGWNEFGQLATARARSVERPERSPEDICSAK